MKKYKLGYTTGVFDLFHVGHLNILKRAKLQCNHLIVGVTTDELCLNRKNKNPIIPFEERVEIVNSISYVDSVVPQISMNKFSAWKEHKFDAMFVGDDWKGTDRWNKIEKQFQNVGVDIVYCPYTQTTSSTLIRKVLHDKLNDLKKAN